MYATLAHQPHDGVMTVIEGDGQYRPVLVDSKQGIVMKYQPASVGCLGCYHRKGGVRTLNRVALLFEGKAMLQTRDDS